MEKRKTYKRSERCEISYVQVGWNVLDAEQLQDLEFVEASPNKAGKIKECVRRIRLHSNLQDMAQFGMLESGMIQTSQSSDDIYKYREISRQESLDMLVD